VGSSLVRRATVADIPELLRLRVVMFDAMGIDAANPEWTITTIRILERDLESSAIVGAVVDRDEGRGLCATGLLHVQETLGSPPFPKGLRGHISSVAVDLEWRKRGLGESILQYLLGEARHLGLERVDLNATPDGERIYRRLGFHEPLSGVDLRLDL
jgi:GNAT superfamily N-acetyltransferase